MNNKQRATGAALAVSTVICTTLVISVWIWPQAAFHITVGLFVYILALIALGWDQNVVLLSLNGFVLLYMIYSLLAEHVSLFSGHDLPIVSNIISSVQVVIALGSASFRRNERFFTHNVQFELLIVFVLTLDIPINLLQKNTDILVVLVRIALFWTLFGLEVYLTNILNYPSTNAVQLFLVSFFVLVVDPWYLLASILVVASHFAEIGKKGNSPKQKSKQKFRPNQFDADEEFGLRGDGEYDDADAAALSSSSTSSEEGSSSSDESFVEKKTLLLKSALKKKETNSNSNTKNKKKLRFIL